jgi:signal transduction histidine kinase
MFRLVHEAPRAVRPDPSLGERPDSEVEALRREVERLRILAASERGLLETIVNHSPHGILVCDAKGKLTLQNRAAERIWRGSATADSVAGWGAYRAFHPDGRPYAAQDWAMARCLSHGEIVEAHEIDILKFDDTSGVLLGSCAPIFGEGGALTGAISVFADITPFKKLERELVTAKAETDLLFGLTDAVFRAGTLDEVFAHALDTITAGLKTKRASILLFDDAGVMRFRAWRGLSEQYRAVVDGHSPWRPDTRGPIPVLVTDADTDPSMEPYRDAFRAEGIRALGFFPLIHGERLIGKFMVYADEPRAFTERDVRLALNVGSHVAQGVARQLVELERARLLEETSAARAAAEQAVRGRDQVLAVVSHDLRNRLNTLTLTARKIASAKDLSALDGTNHRIQRTLTSMNRLISDLLDVSAIDAGMLQVDPKEIDLRRVLEDAVELVRPMSDERRQTVALDGAVDLRLRADPERVVQVLTNILGNAVKFTPAEGVITVSTRLGDDQRFVQFEISDSGPGIAPEHLPHVFDRFWRSRSAAQGVGLGLAIAKGIVEAHGGSISARNGSAFGAVLAFSIPAA